MTKRIDRFVSENRQNIQKIDATFVPISGQQNQNLSFTNTQIQVEVGIEVYTRPLNNGLVSGHPNGTVHGSGHGESGDPRGDWTLVEDTTETAEFVKGGRNNVRDLLDGQPGSYVGEVAVGSGTGTAQPLDSSLESENGHSFAWALAGSQSNEAKGVGILPFDAHSGGVTEYAMFSLNGTMFARVTTSTVNPSAEEEIKVGMTFTVSGDGGGESVVTDVGENRIASAFYAVNSPVGIDSIRYGDGTSTPSESDTGLDNQLFTATANRDLSPETITAHSVVFQGEPSGQPVEIAEIGVFDNEGNLLWRTTVEPFDKTEDVEFDTFVSFRID